MSASACAGDIVRYLPSVQSLNYRSTTTLSQEFGD
jgi:hypothetical protein